MRDFNMGTAWSDGFAFLKDNIQLCLIMAAIGVIIPNILNLVLVGGGIQSILNPEVFASGATSIAEMSSIVGVIFFSATFGIIIQYGSYFAAWRGGLDNDVPLPQAILYGLIAGTTGIVAMILVGIIASLPLLLLFGGVMSSFSGGAGNPGVGSIGITVLMVIAWFVFIIWLCARLIISGPWMADNASYNPFTALVNAWRMSAPGQWAIFGYLILLTIVYVVFAGIIGGVTGLAPFSAMSGANPAAALNPFTIMSTIIGIIVGIPLALVGMAIPMGIYLSMRETDTESIFG